VHIKEEMIEEIMLEPIPEKDEGTSEANNSVTSNSDKKKQDNYVVFLESDDNIEGLTVEEGSDKEHKNPFLR
jgi:hypothetical protein